MTAIEATVRLIENWSITGKLSEMNPGQVYDLTEQVFALFNQKPTTRRKPSEKPAQGAEPAIPGPTHVSMADDPNVAAQAPLEDKRWD